jgi:protein TonB
VAPSLPNVAKVDGVRTSPEPTVTTRRKADEAVFQLFSQKKSEVTVEPKAAKKKWMIVGGISAGAILLPLILMLTMFHHGAKAATKPSLQPIPGASDTQSNTNTPAAKPPAEGKPLPTTGGQKTTDAQPADEQQGTTSAQVQPTMMNNQLTAPARIPKQEAENAPPPETAGADGLGGGNASVSMFNGHSQPNVKVASSRPVAISSGVATGMLIQKAPPEYPPIAKTAHVAGTVELHATIATNGTIKDLHAVSGPVILRQAALDAVRNWRYKPYKLNNEPVEVETTVNVVFSLGN